MNKYLVKKKEQVIQLEEDVKVKELRKVDKI